MKKILSIILSLMLVLCAFPLNAFAAEKTLDTPASGYSEYDRYKVSGNDAEYIDSLSYDQMASIILDWVDRQIVAATADFENFEIEAMGTTIAVDIPEIKGIDDIIAYSSYLKELGGDFANLDITNLASLSRENGDINFIYGVLQFMADNSEIFGKVFHWEEGKVFDYGKVGEYIEGLDTSIEENKKIRDFYDNYLIGNDIQEKFIAEIVKEMNYTIPTDENGKRAETFDQTISNGVIAWFAGLCEANGVLSEDGLATLKTYDLRTTDIYTLVKNFVALVETDNEVEIDTYYNYIFDTVVRTLLKTTLGQQAVVGETVAVPEGFVGTYSDIALLKEISGGTAYYKAGDAYYQITIADDYTLTANVLAWTNALDINFEAPTATIYTGANADEVVQVYRPTSKDNLKINTYASAKNQALMADMGLEFDGETVTDEYAALMIDANAKTLADSFGITVAQGEEIISELVVTFTEIEEFAEVKALEAAKAAIAATGLDANLVSVEDVDITIGYKGWATEDEFIAQVLLDGVSVKLGGTFASMAQSAADSAAKSAVGTYIDNPVATIVVDGLSGNLNIDDAKELLDFIDTDFDIDADLLAFSANYDTYNGVVGQANHILYGLVDMLVSDAGMEKLNLVDGNNDNFTANLQKVCDVANEMMTAAEEVMNDEGLQTMLAEAGIDLSAILGELDLDLLYDIDFSSVEGLWVSVISMGLDIIDDGSNETIAEIHAVLEGLTNLDAMAVATTDYILGKCIPDANAKFEEQGLALTIPAKTDAKTVADGEGKDIIMTKLVDVAYEATTWAFDGLLNGIVNDFIGSINGEADTDLPEVAFSFGVEKGATWDVTLAAMVNRVYELADGIIIACDNEYTDTFDKISAVANAMLPLGSLASNCASDKFAFDVNKVMGFIFDDALDGDLDGFLRLFETAEKTEDVAAGVPVTKALINASQHIVDAIFPGTVVADNYIASETVKEDFTSGDNDVIIASNNMDSINARKTHLVPAVLDLVRESGILPYFAACNHESGTETIPGTPATCKAEGKEDAIVCVACGYTISGGETIPSLKHVFGEWTVKTEATCAADGEEVRSCTYNCGKTETRPIPALDHEFGEWKVTTPATCDKAGVETRVCPYGHSETRPIAKLGHSYGEWTTIIDASCTASGIERKFCGNCGGYEERTITQLDHTDNNGDEICDGCGANLGEEEDNSLFGKIKAFFQKIIDWFKNLFKF